MVPGGVRDADRGWVLGGSRGAQVLRAALSAHLCTCSFAFIRRVIRISAQVLGCHHQCESGGTGFFFYLYCLASRQHLPLPTDGKV